MDASKSAQQTLSCLIKKDLITGNPSSKGHLDMHGPVAQRAVVSRVRGVISHLQSTGAAQVSPGMMKAGVPLTTLCFGLPGQEWAHWTACALPTPEATCFLLPFLATGPSLRGQPSNNQGLQKECPSLWSPRCGSAKGL